MPRHTPSDEPGSSPCHTLAAPIRPTQAPRAKRRRWCDAFLYFVRKLSLRAGGRRLVLKSPAHTARVALLLELFPDAQFVYIHRDPLTVYQSAVHMARTTYWYMYLAAPTDEQIHEFILNQFEVRCRDERSGRHTTRCRGLALPCAVGSRCREPRACAASCWYMYLAAPRLLLTASAATRRLDATHPWPQVLWREYAADRGAIPAGALHELSFEELTHDPAAALGAIYAKLGLEGYEARVRPRVEAQVGGRLRGYKKNEHADVDPAVRALVARRWADYIAAWGYKL